MKFFKMLNLKDQHLPAFKKRMWKVLGLLVLLVVCVKLFILGINYASDRYACYSKWVDSTVESKYTLRGGCLVQVKGDWIPAENYRVN